MSDKKPLSQNAIGLELGVSSACMVKWKKQGCPMDSVESVRAWRKAKQNIAARKPEPVPDVEKFTPAPPALKDPGFNRVGGDDFATMIRENDAELAGMAVLEDLDEARTRLMIADANMAEMKEAEMLGKLRKKSEVDSKAFEVARALRDGLTNCARRIAAEVSALGSADDCEAVIDREHRAMMDNLWNQLTNELSVSAPAEAA